MVGVVAIVPALCIAASGWACVPIATVTVTPAEARPGQEVTVSGIRFLGPKPVVLHLHTFDGPVLATMEMPRSANTLFKTTVTVPPDTPPGPLVLVATQEAFSEGGFAGWGVPARAVLTVLDPAGNAPPSTLPAVGDRRSDLTKESFDPVVVLLVTFGVAATALLAVGVAAAAATRHRPATAASPEAVDR